MAEGSPRSAARVLHDFIEYLPRILLQTSDGDRTALDRGGAAAVARLIGEAATTATNRTQRLCAVHAVSHDVRSR